MINLKSSISKAVKGNEFNLICSYQPLSRVASLRLPWKRLRRQTSATLIIGYGFVKVWLPQICRHLTFVNNWSIENCHARRNGCFNYLINRRLALRGHVTNASFKQWNGILLMPKIDKAHKNYLIPKFERKAFKGDILWHFDFSTK